MERSNNLGHWWNLVNDRYEDKYILLLDKFMDQLSDFLGGSPSEEFVNDYLNKLQSQHHVNPIRALYDSIYYTYGRTKAMNFVSQNKELNKTVRELKVMINDLIFCVVTQKACQKLNKIPIYCN